jgi:DNA modification methylase
MKKTKLMLGDNIESLKKLPDNSIDSIVTDPPYGLSFMNKKWDYDVPSVDFWKEVYRVLKPGGHILSFGGTRTYHRMVVNIEDAGFEIRDQIMWLYGSGFPKSLNIGKAVDKIEGNEREVVGEMKGAGTPGSTFTDENGRKFNSEYIGTKGQSEWEGWGTALKPANEPICLARKPLSEGTIAENVLKWGTGGINIDGCRVGNDNIKSVYGGFTNALVDGRNEDKRKEWIDNSKKENGQFNTNENEGRFPANIILDEIAGELLDEQSGQSKSSGHKIEKRNNNSKDIFGIKYYHREKSYVDNGGASRFFYQAKVSKAERNMGLDGFEEKQTKTQNNFSNEVVAGKFQALKAPAKNHHPTVKPVTLMTYLCRLVTPPGGIVLDPFMGSGSTGISALLEGFRFVGMEMDKEYFKIAEARINSYEEYRKFIKK